MHDLTLKLPIAHEFSSDFQLALVIIGIYSGQCMHVYLGT